MKSILIKYKRFGFWDKSISLALPATWGELTVDQFLTVALLYKSGMSDDEFVSRFFSLSPKLVGRMDPFQKYTLINQLKFVLKITKGVPSFYYSSIPGTKMYSPEEYLGGVSLQQFMTVDTYFSRYLSSENKEMLHHMIASLYLRKKDAFNLTEEDHSGLLGRRRVLVDIETRARELERVDDNIKHAILFNFILLKEWLSSIYPHLFPKSEEDLPTDRKGKPMKALDWLELFDKFVGDNIPSMNQYQAMPAMDAFRIINRRIKESKKHGRN